MKYDHWHLYKLWYSIIIVYLILTTCISKNYGGVIMSNITMDQVAVMSVQYFQSDYPERIDIAYLIAVDGPVDILIPCIVVELKISTYGEHRHIIAD